MSIWLLVVIPVFVDLQLNTSFQQRTTVLSPIISDVKFKELRAEWALMKNRNDYLKINKEMDDIAKNNGISLPEPLLK
jgi:hypothetical protein